MFRISDIQPLCKSQLNPRGCDSQFENHCFKVSSLHLALMLAGLAGITVDAYMMSSTEI